MSQVVGGNAEVVRFEVARKGLECETVIDIFHPPIVSVLSNPSALATIGVITALVAIALYVLFCALSIKLYKTREL